jgi:YD repeat-containing protein
MTDSTGTTTYGYDTAGALASIVGTGTNVAYSYDPAGNRATMTSAGVVTAYTYDGANRLATVSRPGVGTFGFAYNPDGQLATITRSNGVTSTNSYDTAGRLTGLTYKNAGGTTIAAYAYTLDADGNRVSASTAGASDHYAIDPAGRHIPRSGDSGRTWGHRVQPLRLRGAEPDDPDRPEREDGGH